MAEKISAQLKRLESRKERAGLLLSHIDEMTTTIDMVDLTPVARAVVGDVKLPITATTERECLELGKAWLREMAEREW